MFSALGLSRDEVIVARCKPEFSDTELLEYFRLRDIEVDIPEWLPRRPLICQTISDLASDQFETMFGEQGDEVQFWHHFIRVLCERDARIHISFDPDTIQAIFIYLSRLTCSKSANVGPISPVELQSAFEAVTGASPVEEASVMLQRLPSLGRVNAESSDRQFVDVYILDGLRAKDIVRACLATKQEFSSVATSQWINPLDDLGQRVLSSDGAVTEASRLDFARRSLELGNKVMACDLVSSLTRSSSSPIDFCGIEVSNGEFLCLRLSEREMTNLTLRACYIGELAFPAKGVSDFHIVECETPRVTGITSPAALPDWVTRLHAEEFDSVESVSRIRKIGLRPSHEILIAIIRKTFFQKGSGRKEEALLRGLNTVASKATSRKIINIMIREGLLTTFKGNEGNGICPRAVSREQDAEDIGRTQVEFGPALVGGGDPLTYAYKVACRGGELDA